MYSKFIIVLATLCVANASVVINVFDEDPDIGVQSGVKDCNPTACEQLCRRLKFPGGACVNGRCKCDNFRSENEAVLELSPSDLETFSALGEESENELSANDCNPTACDQLCRRLKFPGGACVNGRCKCDNFRNSEEAVLELSPSDLEAFSSLEDEPISEAEEVERSRCNLSACEQHCRRLKLPGGACVNGRCKCDKFLSEQVETFETDDLVPEVTSANLEMDSCGIRSCDFICRSMHMARGYCAAGRCQCFRPAGLVDANSEPVVEPAKNQTHGKCRQGLCDLVCRKLKFERGECLENKCKCYKAKVDVMSAPVLEPAKNQTHGKCRQRLCDLVCRKLKFERGECLENKCKCYKAKVDVMSEPVLEPAKNQTHGKCRQRLCDLVCRKLKYHRGECSESKCKCYKDGVARDDNEMPKFSEDLTKVKCTKRVCNQMCRSLEYKGGNCKNGKCWCYGPPKKPARLMQEDTYDEEEVPVSQDISAEEDTVDDNEIPLNELGEDPTKVKCTKRICNRMCRSLDYKGGNCKKGKCYCYGPPKKPAQSVVEDAGKEEQVEQNHQDETTEKVKTVSRLRRATCTKKACNKKCILFGGFCLSGRCICF